MIRKFILFIIIIITLILSCQQPAVKYIYKDSDNTSAEGRVKIGLINNDSSFLAFDYSKAEKVIISIEDSNNNPVYNLHELVLYNLNDQFITEQLTLNTGDYNITEFLVLDESNDIICASPLESSEKASLVNDPLPISFTVVQDQTTNIAVQVLVVEETSTPEEFGYVTFSFEVVETDTDDNNLILNGDFSDNTSDWTLWSNQGTASMSVIDSECIIDITNPGTDFWEMGIGQTGFTLEQGETYTFSFQARSETITTIKATIQEYGNDWTSYSGFQDLVLSTAMTTYSVTFTMSEPTDTLVNLSIFTGAQGTGTVYIDNVVITKFDSTVIDSTPCNPNASPETAAILEYIAYLSSPDVNQAMVGQNCFHGTEITDTTWQDGYNTMIVELYNQSGKWVSIASVDYEYSKIFTPDELSATNQVLIEHWNKGGLIAINWVPLNPWINDESDIINNPGSWDAPGNAADHTGVTSLKDLIDPTSTIYEAWRRKLDRIADALMELQNAGVVVLWRPLGEMNAPFWWWGTLSHLEDSSDYTELYQDMYNYFTNVKHLNNLLWVYSPNGNVLGLFNCMTVDWAYPGDDYVDIIADTCYSDELYVESYDTYITMGNPLKPITMGEWGPTFDGDITRNGTFDTRNYIEKIRTDYTRFAYFLCWHSYEADPNDPESYNQFWSIITNQYYNEMMNDPDVITIDKLTWQSYLNQ